MAHISSAAESTSYFTIPSAQRSRDAIYICLRLGNISRLWRQRAFPSLTNCLGVLRRSEAVSQHSSFVVSLGLPVSRCCAGADEAWLRKWYTGRYTVIPARSSPGGHECCGSTRVPVQSIRPHHTAASACSLAACAKANDTQTGCTSLPVSPWTCAGLPGWRFTACHRTTWSTTPALVVDFAALAVPLTRLSTIGDWTFPVATAKIWYNLSSEVTSLDYLQIFKTKLKTHLFSSSFPQLTAK